MIRQTLKSLQYSRKLLETIPKFGFAQGPIDINSVDEFKTHVAENQKPVLIDFHAEWCGPCKVLAPMIEQRVKDAEGDWDFVKINIDEQQEIAQMFNIQSIPTVFLVHKGQGVEYFMGANEDKLNQLVDQAEELSKKEE